jgi:hypothetical protein
MQELLKAIKEIKSILHESEEERDDFQEVLGKLGQVKIHGVRLPTLMLIEIVDDFVKGYQERRKASMMEGFDEEETQKKYDAVSLNWNTKDTVN